MTGCGPLVKVSANAVMEAQANCTAGDDQGMLSGRTVPISAVVADEEFAVFGVGLGEAFVEGGKAYESAFELSEAEGQISINIDDTMTDSTVVDDDIAGLAAIFVEEAIIAAADEGSAGMEIHAFLGEDEDDLSEAIESGFGGGDGGAEV